MALSFRGIRELCVPGAVLLLVACGGGEPEEPAAVDNAREWMPLPGGAELAAREQQSREEAQAAEQQQAVLALESAPPAVLSEQQFYQEIAYYCGACHIQVAGAEPYPIGYFDDLDRMIELGKVLPGNAEGSPVVVHMRADQTPRDGWNTPPVTDIAIELVADFINQLPAESDESANGR